MEGRGANGSEGGDTIRAVGRCASELDTQRGLVA